MNAKRKPAAVEMNLAELVPWRQFARDNPHLGGSMHSWHWLVVRMSPENGLRACGAVIKFRNKLFVNPTQFRKWMAEQNGLTLQGQAA